MRLGEYDAVLQEMKKRRQETTQKAAPMQSSDNVTQDSCHGKKKTAPKSAPKKTKKASVSAPITTPQKGKKKKEDAEMTPPMYSKIPRKVQTSQPANFGKRPQKPDTLVKSGVKILEQDGATVAVPAESKKLIPADLSLEIDPECDDEYGLSTGPKRAAHSRKCRKLTLTEREQKLVVVRKYFTDIGLTYGYFQSTHKRPGRGQYYGWGWFCARFNLDVRQC